MVDMKKKLAKYLVDYIEQEVKNFEQDSEDKEADSLLLVGWIEQGLEAFMSIENVNILISDKKKF